MIARVKGATGTTGVVTSIEFQVVNAIGPPIDMTPGNITLRYSDKNQVVNMDSSSEFTAANIAALGDADQLLEPTKSSKLLSWT